MARFVNETGTGPIGMEKGARIQVTAVITPITASWRTENFCFSEVGGVTLFDVIHLIDKFSNNWIIAFLGMAAGTIICYGFGTAWLAYQAHLDWKAALFAGVIPFIYIYLNSDYGRTLVCRQTYGSVVDMIDDKSLASVEIPVLNKNLSV